MLIEAFLKCSLSAVAGSGITASAAAYCEKDLEAGREANISSTNNFPVLKSISFFLRTRGAIEERDAAFLPPVMSNGSNMI